MTAFFYHSPVAHTIVRNINPLSAPPGPFNLPAPNQYYARASWQPANAQYSDLVG